MRLLCLHADTIRALASLHAPFDDLTPDGLWGTDYHLIGVTADQRDVLRGFGVDLEDVTPAQLDAGAARTPSAGRTASTAPRTTPRADTPSSRESLRAREGASSVTREPSRDAGRGTESVELADRPATSPSTSPATAQSSAPAANAGQDVSIARSKPPSNGGVATRAPMKLRTRLKGKYKEAFVQDGKIHLDGHKFDSPVHASKSLSADKKDWELWEYYDDDAGKWYMLDREWENA